MVDYTQTKEEEEEEEEEQQQQQKRGTPGNEASLIAL